MLMEYKKSYVEFCQNRRYETSHVVKKNGTKVIVKNLQEK